MEDEALAFVDSLKSSSLSAKDREKIIVVVEQKHLLQEFVFRQELELKELKTQLMLRHLHLSSAQRRKVSLVEESKLWQARHEELEVRRLTELNEMEEKEKQQKANSLRRLSMMHDIERKAALRAELAQVRYFASMLIQKVTRKRLERTQRDNELEKANAKHNEMRISIMKDKEEEDRKIAARITMSIGSQAPYPLRLGLQKILELDTVRTQRGNAHSKFHNERGLRDLRLGQPEAGVLGLAVRLKVDDEELHKRMAKGTRAIIDEFEVHGSPVDNECLDYVLNKAAGSDATLFGNSAFPRDCDENGPRADRILADGSGMKLEDFLNHRHAQKVGLKEHHVVALRLYTTAAFQSMNAPLRSETPHPLPATIKFLAEGIGKLRAAGSDDGNEPPAGSKTGFDTVMKTGSGRRLTRSKTGYDTVMEMWRGMSNLSSTAEFERQGGSEAAPMSTTTDPVIAVAYGQSRSALLFKIVADNFVHRGADISWLSAFPAEKEYLYPPLTYLQPTGRRESVHFDEDEIHAGSPEMDFHVIEVKPEVSTA